MRTLRLLALLTALPFAGCRPSLLADLERIQAEIDKLEYELNLPDTAPIWITQKDADERDDIADEQVFSRYIQDHTATIPGFLYDHVMGKLAGMEDKEIADLSGGAFPYEEALKDPDTYRGGIWRINGTIVRVGCEKYTDPESPIPEAFTGAAYSGREKPFLFHVIVKPEVLNLREDTVELQGVFVKIISVGEPGNRRSAPLFLARSLKRFI